MTNIHNIKKVLIPRFDSHGDIILLSGFLISLLEKKPDVEITILIRPGHEQLASLFPHKINWITINIFPYRPIVSDDIPELNKLLSLINDGGWDVLLTTCYIRTWLDYVIAAKFKGSIRYAIGGHWPVPEWICDLLNWLHLPHNYLWDIYVDVDESIHEVAKYDIFFKNIFNCSESIHLPNLEINETSEALAKKILESLSLGTKNYFVCLPAGTHNITIKCWPPDRFVELLLRLQSELGLTPLLVGHELEVDIIEYVQSKVLALGGTAKSWLGRNGEFHILAAIMREARFYVGNDSGPMHMATAVGIPTVGIFGGGYWPRFLPVGQYSVGVASALPCFGCDWNCTFEDAPCVKAVQISDVLGAVKYVLQGTNENDNVLIVEHQLNQVTLDYIRKAHNQYVRCKSNSNKILNEKSISKLPSNKFAHKISNLLERLRKL